MTAAPAIGGPPAIVRLGSDVNSDGSALDTADTR